MHRKLATAMALAFVVGAVGLSIVPTVAAVTADCDDDYAITATKQSRSLNTSESEVGLSEVRAADGDETMTVTLQTNSAKLEFGVFIVDPSNGNCVSAKDEGVSDCGTAEVLDTTDSNVDPPISIDCRLDAPLTGTRDFYVPFENIGNVGLTYDAVSVT